jgi:hypothetical protein
VLIYGCIVREFFGRKAGVEIEGERLRPSVACAGEAPLRRITNANSSAPPAAAQPPVLGPSPLAKHSGFASIYSLARMRAGKEKRMRAPRRASDKLLASLATSVS